MNFSINEACANFLSPIDIVIFLGVLAVTMLMPVLQNSIRLNSKETLGHLLVGRRLTLPFFVASLVATWYGGIMSVTRIAFEQGVYNFLTQGLFWYGAYLVFALFLVDRIFQHPHATSLASIVGELCGPQALRICSIINLINVMPVAYLLSLGFLLKTLLGGSAWFWMVVAAIVISIYTTVGGVRTVILSDLWQATIMILGIVGVVIFSIIQIGSPSLLFSALPPQMFDPKGGEGWDEILVWGFIAFSTLVDPNFYQRCLASHTKKVAKRGILWAICFWIVIDLCTTLGALYARMVIPQAPAETAYLSYSLQLLPDGYRGFFCASLCAMIVSTVDSYFVTGSQALVGDLLGFRSVAAQRWGVIVIASLSCFLGWQFDGNIKVVLKFFGSLSAACLFVPLMLHYIPWLSPPRGMLVWCVVLSFLSMALAPLLPWTVEPFYLGCLASLAVYMVYSPISALAGRFPRGRR